MEMNYTIVMNDGGGAKESIELEADSLDALHKLARAATRDWIVDGNWGDDGDGAVVEGGYTIQSDDDEYHRVRVEIEPDHEHLISVATRNRESCGPSPDDHDWSSQGEGGCRENPGVWSHGGTTLSFRRHCQDCGLQRLEVSLGAQRNPGDHDTVDYTMPDGAWCREHQAFNCEEEG
jgi:hypothetical protein